MLSRLWPLALLLHTSFAGSSLVSNLGEEASQVSQQERKYLIYDVNPGEGFNLRRDVYMRIANTVKQLRERGLNYVLVLPPWGNLYHWQRREKKKPWREFFDLESLNEFVPVIEFEDFLKVNGPIIDQVVYLQNYAEGWTNGHFEMKADERECISADQYYLMEGNLWRGIFFSYENVRAKKLVCLSIQGQSSTLADAIEAKYTDSLSIMIDRGETILHDEFGGYSYWSARKSMKYSKKVHELSNAFKATELKEPYMCVHLRRRDFVRSHAKDIPSIEGAAEQILNLSKEKTLKTLYLSTDAENHEVEKLKNLLNGKVEVKRFDASTVSDGTASVVDQWICAHSDYFIGTHLSTFSFRIHEDREILGYKPEATFNRLCADGEESCEQPTKWRIVNDPKQRRW
ncbi:hypothetical protein QR680_014881 [Steinernema hermaphroditum]|uniref:GDP-fucose protein O-fucosyltransferase 2 n=1 Tax=Steinernema hermaphroditum TaxID=289476 RepID=A0AA39ICN2_9BILA|nr:hypothetical protein QR680_014881 [Steinernema hermaphroditum]